MHISPEPLSLSRSILGHEALRMAPALSPSSAELLYRASCAKHLTLHELWLIEAKDVIVRAVKTTARRSYIDTLTQSTIAVDAAVAGMECAMWATRMIQPSSSPPRGPAQTFYTAWQGLTLGARPTPEQVATANKDEAWHNSAAGLGPHE